ncbi:hypothetical protein B0H16DRAFT_1878614 [Mycena metata]|uniref:Uncharacterized protein n=1 Tax=Mycena metata TaxID=1033252 RepID=A0AAD7NX88_9AGAR|nr:hypothetical protein B0H16DRAFT_1878614 [Mycena metata]
MAELAAGLVGAAATISVASLTTARNTEDFRENLQSGDINEIQEREFTATRQEAVQSETEYHESIENYKTVSWLNPVKKVKQKVEVRRKKRLTRHYNYSLRSLNEFMRSGSDISSIAAFSGSPPGSNLAAENIRDWAYHVAGESDDSDRAPSESKSSLLEPEDDRAHINEKIHELATLMPECEEADDAKESNDGAAVERNQGVVLRKSAEYIRGQGVTNTAADTSTSSSARKARSRELEEQVQGFRGSSGSASPPLLKHSLGSISSSASSAVNPSDDDEGPGIGILAPKSGEMKRVMRSKYFNF